MVFKWVYFKILKFRFWITINTSLYCRRSKRAWVWSVSPCIVVIKLRIYNKILYCSFVVFVVVVGTTVQPYNDNNSNNDNHIICVFYLVVCFSRARELVCVIWLAVTVPIYIYILLSYRCTRAQSATARYRLKRSRRRVISPPPDTAIFRYTAVVGHRACPAHTLTHRGT